MRLVLPPGADPVALGLDLLDHSAMDTSADYRRAVTRTSPLRFALTYLPHRLVMDDPLEPGRQLVSLSELHLAQSEAFAGWMGPAPTRRLWIAPRNAAKTTGVENAALWAIAHGHRRFPVLFGHNAEAALLLLGNLRRELAENELLLADFPDLRPSRVKGTSDTKRTTMRGGATLAARGVDSPNLGLRSGADRPDLLLLDDVEPPGARYSAAGKAKRLETIRDAVLPMNESAAVEWTGTTTMHGSAVHDAVRHAVDGEPVAWVREDGWSVRYWPVILDEGLPTERSLWPDRWSLAWCHSRRAQRSFALNYMNRPEASTDGAYWTREHIVHDPHVPVVEHTLSVDVAVSGRTGGGQDRTALVLVGLGRDGRTAVVEWAWAGRIRGRELLDMIWRNAERNPTLRRVILEKNQGGETWREILSPMPPGVELELYPAIHGKRWRIDRTLARYDERAVVHAAVLGGLEAQMLAYPDVVHDDYLDALGAGVEYVLTGSPVARV